MYIGISPNKFDELVGDGQMSGRRRIDGQRCETCGNWTCVLTICHAMILVLHWAILGTTDDQDTAGIRP